MRRLVAVFCVAGGVALAEDVPARAEATPPAPQVRVARFAGDRPAALSYTFDDNLRDQYTLAVPMLNAVGFKGTFFVIAGKTAETPEEAGQKDGKGNTRNLWGGISWPELKKMAEQGHEIANHTWSHPSLAKLPPAEMEAEISKAYEAIATRIGRPPLTLAFPGNGSNPDVRAVALKRHVAYRAYQQSLSGKSTAGSLNAWADRLVLEKKWGVLMAHGIAAGYAAMSDPEIFRAHVAHVKSRERDIWVDTFARIACYEKERDDAKLTVSGGQGSVVCLLSGTLDPQVYTVPLTLCIAAPGAVSAAATRGGQALPAQVAEGAVLVDAVPGAQPIEVSWR